MKNKLIAAGIGVIALTATGCALPSVEAKEVVSTPTQEPTQDTQTPREQYEAYVADEGVYVGTDDAYKVGLLVCENFDSLGYMGTVQTMLNANNQGGAGLDTSDLAAMAVGAAKFLCPEHEAGFREFAASN